MLNLLLIFLLISINTSASIVPNKDANGDIVTKTDAFASKSTYNFYGIGKVFTAPGSASSSMEFAVDQPHLKFNGIRISDGQVGDTANLKILDTATGTYSGYPNATLNQFGFNWNLTADIKEMLPYASDLYSGMRIVIEYTNTNPSSSTIYVNYYLHKE